MPITKPIVATGELSGHSLEEIRLAKAMKRSVSDMFDFINGDKKGKNAKDAMIELMREIETEEKPAARKFTRDFL